MLVKIIKLSLFLLNCVLCTSLQAITFAELAQKDIKVNLEGRLLADAAWYSKDNRFDRPQMGDGTDFRQLRLGARGTVCPICRYHVDIDFAGNNVSIANAFMSFNITHNTNLTIGHVRAPFSLEEMTSTLFITFIERGLPNIFTPKRRLGIELHRFGKLSNSTDYVIKLGGFGEGATDTQPSGGNEGYNAAARLNIIHHFGEQCFWLLGGSASYTRTNDDNHLQYNPAPESNVTAARLVDTGTIEFAKGAQLYGLESVLQLNRLSLQAEFMHNSVKRSLHYNDLDFNGLYVFASYFLTPDSRNLSSSSATFRRIAPTSKYGAVELATRFSYIDLQDEDILGGHQRNVSVGLNWYVNSYIRFMANIIKANAKKDNIKTAPTIYTLRAQLDFD